jgi:hypothetical protein
VPQDGFTLEKVTTLPVAKMPATFAKLSLLWLLGQSWSAIVYCSDAQGAKISPALVIVSGIFATDHAVTSVIVIQLNK